MTKELMIQMYYNMFRIRRFEETVSELFAKGLIPGFVHLYIGEEAVAVGVCSALNSDDYITSTHRGHGHVLAKGGRMDKALAELSGKFTGYNKGKGGSMHMAAVELGILGANGIVGAGLPIATGAGLSAKYLNNGRVAVCFFGDGASNEGTFHEAINLASAFDLPVIYVCENNLYGVTTLQSRVRKVEHIADRAAGYGIPGHIVDGNNVMEVYRITSEAVRRARDGGGPSLIECKTYRHRLHFEGERDVYRPKEEVEEWRKRDPIEFYKGYLIEKIGIPANELSAAENEVEREIIAAQGFVLKSPEPALEEALVDVYGF